MALFNPETGSEEVDDSTSINQGLSNRKQVAPILYISSAILNVKNGKTNTTSFEYFVKIISYLSTSINKLDTIQADLVLKLPESNLIGEEQSNILRKVLENKKNYSAIVISPLEIGPITNVIKDKIKSIDEYLSCPIFFIDKYIGQNKKKPVSLVEGVVFPFFTSDWYEGGALIAEEIHKLYMNKSSVKVLILKGLEGSQIRIDGFKSYVKKYKLDSIIKYEVYPKSKVLDFTREDALKFCKEHLLINNDYDAIFTCNDEMAIGANQAVLELIRDSHIEELKDVKIFGFDGIRDFQRLAQVDNSNLTATIDVKLDEQVYFLMYAIENFLTDTENFKKGLENVKNSKFHKALTPTVVTYGARR